jgi:hypothetical protein
VTVIKGAVVSNCGLYRYELTRRWAAGPLMTWVMLNPSTADAEVDDPTIRRCMSFAQRDGFPGIRVVNLFALRATKPVHLTHHPDPFGPLNRRYLSTAIEAANDVVVGWGAWYGTHAIDLPLRFDVVGHAEDVDVPVWCLGTTAAGAPRHPLYVRGDTSLRPFSTRLGVAA